MKNGINDKEVNLENENLNNKELDEPILIIKRARLFYGPIYTIVKILQLFVGVIFVNLDKNEPYTTIIGCVIIIGLFYIELLASFKMIICYNDKFVINFVFWKKTIMFSQIKEFGIYTIPISFKKILFIRVNFVMDFLNLNRFCIPMDYINKNDFEKFKNILQNRNVKYFDFKALFLKM